MKKTLLRSVPIALTLVAIAATAAYASRQPNAVKRREARKTCLAEDSTLRGKKLKACVSEKMKAPDAPPASP